MLKKVKLIPEILRLKEIFLMTGFSVIGNVFTDKVLWENGRDFYFSYAMIFSFVLAVYLLNSYADYSEDQQSERLDKVSGITRMRYLVLMCMAVIAFVFFGGLLGVPLVVVCVVSFILWGLYYLKPIRLKATLLLGTLIHFLCGTLHFQMGYGYTQPIDEHSILIATYYGMLLSMGHMNHEMLDFKNDQASATKTTAIRIGIQNVSKLRSFIAVISFAYLFILYFRQSLTWQEFILLGSGHFIILTLLLGFSSRISPMGFQKVMRSVMLITGIALVIIKTL
ncbi:MAG: UbiA family prenyltransferase [Bacteroidetes bacterium]|nr:UbiA family prenyltransferase [Bacteroidota bacterium]